MIRSRLQKVIDECFTEGVQRGWWSGAAAGKYALEIPKREGQGDYATNFALVTAGCERANPREIAARLTELLAARCDLTDKVEIAGPGFVNFFIKPSVWQSVLPEVCSRGDGYGPPDVGKGKKVLVEFVSANPTGPLSVGHGRQAVLGDAVARLLDACGFDVTREYYYNDAGRQMRVLARSVEARYRELLGADFDFPEDGYRGEYIIDIAKSLVDDHGDALLASDDLSIFKKRAEEMIFADINATLERLGVFFDNYFNEHSLYDDGHIDDVVSRLRGKGLVYDKDGAVWFKTTEFGMEKDRVIIKSSGEPTYRLPDIAYHREKFRRGFDWMVDIFGSDHIATVPDVLAGIKALGYDDSKVTVVLHQFVTLMREGKQVKMSTRKATFVTIDELVDEVGVDVVRFFFLMRKADSQLEFDLDLAKEQSQENPVYYVQYGHARMCSILRQAKEKGADAGPLEGAPVSLLTEPEELALLKDLAGYPEFVRHAALELEPHRIIYFLQNLAAKFHAYYNKHRVISNDQALTRARLWLIMAVKVVFRNGLVLLGVDAPERM